MTDGLQAITFDVGGTLIKPWPSVGHVYAAVAKEQFVEDLPPGQLNDRFATAWKSLGCRAESRQDWAAIVEATFRGIDSVADPRSLFEALYERFTEPGSWHVFEDVRPTLDTLRARGVRMAVVSNWDDRLRPLLTRLRLFDYFETAVVSCEIGFRKPQPEMFRQAASQLGVGPECLLHVGDSLEHDLLGARAVGMQALGICRARPVEDSSWINSLHRLTEAF